VLPAFLTAICFACTAISAQQSTSLIGPLRANLYRLLVALLILSCGVLFFYREMPVRLATEFAIAGAIGFGGGGFCMMQALRRLGSPQSLLLVESQTAIFAGLGAWLFLQDTLTPTQLLFCGVIIGGILFAGSSWIQEKASTTKTSIAGHLFTAGAAFFQAISLVISRHAFLSAAATGVPVNTFHAAFLRLAGGLIAAVLMLLLAGKLRNVMKQTSGSQSTSLFVMGNPLHKQPVFWIVSNAVFGPVLGVTCWLWAVSLLNPGLVQSIAATAPLISIPISRKLEHHRLGIRFYIGGPIAILGLAGLVLW
jgi:drug/metabolite transporter (DMT)-like permease